MLFRSFMLFCKTSAINKPYNGPDHSAPFVSLLSSAYVLDYFLGRIEEEGEENGGAYFFDLFEREGGRVAARAVIDNIEQNYPELLARGLKPDPGLEQDRGVWNRLKKENPATAEARFEQYLKINAGR